MPCQMPAAQPSCAGPHPPEACVAPRVAAMQFASSSGFLLNRVWYEGYAVICFHTRNWYWCASSCVMPQTFVT